MAATFLAISARRVVDSDAMLDRNASVICGGSGTACTSLIFALVDTAIGSLSLDNRLSIHHLLWIPTHWKCSIIWIGNEHPQLQLIPRTLECEPFRIALSKCHFAEIFAFSRVVMF